MRLQDHEEILRQGYVVLELELAIERVKSLEKAQLTVQFNAAVRRHLRHERIDPFRLRVAEALHWEVQIQRGHCDFYFRGSTCAVLPAQSYFSNIEPKWLRGMWNGLICGQGRTS